MQRGPQKSLARLSSIRDLGISKCSDLAAWGILPREYKSLEINILSLNINFMLNSYSFPIVDGVLGFWGFGVLV